jgi:hypothetical protein
VGEADERQVRLLLELYGHLLDARAWGRLNEVFTVDVVMDATAAGLRAVHGLQELTAWWSDPGTVHPLGHHATNILVADAGAGRLWALSKGITVFETEVDPPRTRVSSIVYDDELVQLDGSWRITRRWVARGAPPAAASAGPANC